VSAPASKEEWAEVAEELARFRAGRGPVDEVGFGLDPDALVGWAAADALDTMVNVVSPKLETGDDPTAVFGAALAMHTQVGIEIGLYLVMSGRVQP
jgi:hypothetical protein